MTLPLRTLLAMTDTTFDLCEPGWAANSRASASGQGLSDCGQNLAQGVRRGEERRVVGIERIDALAGQGGVKPLLQARRDGMVSAAFHVVAGNSSEALFACLHRCAHAC